MSLVLLCISAPIFSEAKAVNETPDFSLAQQLNNCYAHFKKPKLAFEAVRTRQGLGEIPASSALGAKEITYHSII